MCSIDIDIAAARLLGNGCNDNRFNNCLNLPIIH